MNHGFFRKLGQTLAGLSLTCCFLVGGGLTPESVLADASQYQPLLMDVGTLNANTVFGVNENYEGVCPFVSNIRLDQGAAFFVTRESDDGGFPKDGKLDVNGIPFKLASGGNPETAYDGNDSIVLKVPGETYTALRFEPVKEHTLNLDTIGVYDELHILATAAGPGAGNWMDFDVILHYTDGEDETVSFDLYDWYDSNSDEGSVQRYSSFRRVNGNHWSYTEDFNDADDAGTCNENCQHFDLDGTSNGGPYLFVLSVNPDQSRLLKAVTFELASANGNSEIGNAWGQFGIYGGIYAVTGSVNENAPGAPVATAATGATGDSFHANWNGVNGADSYVLDVAEDEEFKRILPGYANRDVGDVESFEVTGADRSKTLYYRVRAVNANGQSLSSNVISLEGETAVSGGHLPQTGDRSQLHLWLALCLLSLAAYAASRRTLRVQEK